MAALSLAFLVGDVSARSALGALVDAGVSAAASRFSRDCVLECVRVGSRSDARAPVSKLSWRQVFFCASVITIVLAVPALFLARDRPPPATPYAQPLPHVAAGGDAPVTVDPSGDTASSDGGSSAGGVEGGPSAGCASTLALLRVPGFRYLLAVIAGMYLTREVFLQTGKSFLLQVRARALAGARPLTMWARRRTATTGRTVW